LWEIEEQQLRWYSHVMQMEECRIARQVAEWNPQGKRKHNRLLAVTCKQETLRMRNVLIESSGGNKISLGWGKLYIHRKIHIYNSSSFPI
jgi:hypothetical protein